MTDRATHPLALLKQLRGVFEHDAANLRKEAQSAFSELQQRAINARAYACENAVEKIDATLKDWE